MNNLTARLKKGLQPLQCLALIGLCCVGSAQAEMVQLNPNQDNTLYERPMGDVSNAIGNGLFFGQTGGNAGNLLRRTLMSFDVNNTIPSGSTINSVSLQISVDMVPPGATPIDINLHRLTNSWGEGSSEAVGAGGSGAPSTTGDATWLHRFYDTDLWSTPGGDFIPQSSATTTIGAGTGDFTFVSTPELVADVQSWVDTPASNNGWILLGAEATTRSARRISSRENGAGAPMLVVDFTAPVNPPPPPPGAVAVPTLNGAGLALLMLGIMVMMARRLKSRA
jgi:hypothetical protein